jgi:hypothetical protein
VAPLITQFLDTRPEVTIDLQLLDRAVGLVEEDFDPGEQFSDRTSSGPASTCAGRQSCLS